MLSQRILILVVPIVVFLAGCRTQPARAPVIGEAYVGPASLNLRKDLAPGTPITATVKHGDRLGILQHRRRFVKVRTVQGVEGWTDSRQLISPEQMAYLRQASERSSALPSQGVATVLDPLNVHTEPVRTSPSFYQVPENGKVDVIGHRQSPRIAPPAAAPARRVPAQETYARKSKDKPVDKSRIVPPPPPPAPKLPADWLARSQSTPAEPDQSLALSNRQVSRQKDGGAPPAPPKMDDWSLIRMKDGKVGWVLTRMLTMAIPDEVAQYAEGHRITSYFAMGDVNVEGTVKHNWLWTTVSGSAPYEFDSFRFFIFNPRRRRYETAYIERNVRGYYPVQPHQPGSAQGGKRPDEPSFSLVIADKEGKLYRRTYGYQGYHIRLISKEPWTRPPEDEVSPGQAETIFTETPVASPSLRARVAGWWRGLTGKR